MNGLLLTPFLLLTTFCISLGQTNNIDSTDSYISFNVSNMAVNTVEGKIYGMWGDVAFDPGNLSASKIVAQIDPTSVTTGNDTRDKHLKGPDYFSTGAYPSIRFESSSILKEGGHYIAAGILIMKGTSKNIEIQFTEMSVNERRVLEGTITLDRYEYSIGSKGGFTIGRDVEIKIYCVLM